MDIPAAVMTKPGGRIRLYIGPITLDKTVQRVQYCVPTINDILP
jgi:hypothetical protein